MMLQGFITIISKLFSWSC